jgi:hypothetical protein
MMSWFAREEEWAPLVRINEPWGENWPDKRCGIFRLVGIASDAGPPNPVAIDRVSGRDESGTLYIGLAEGSLDAEISNVIKSITGSRKHRAGIRLQFLAYHYVDSACIRGRNGPEKVF